MQREFEALKPQLNLDEDGRLRLRGQEMILLPRHFFRYIVENVERHAGPEAFDRIFGQAGYDGALQFCRKFHELHGGTPTEVVQAYLDEMSLRGWGRFQIVRIDPERCELQVELEGSALVPEGEARSAHIIWRHAMRGAMDFVQQQLGTQHSLTEELQETGHGCRISVSATQQAGA
jgi:hypothetical protein